MDRHEGCDAAVTIYIRSSLQLAPPEVLDIILAHLGPVDLARAMRTCRAIAVRARDEARWQQLVQENVPGIELTSPYPCSSFRELYAAHDPYWFLTKHKLWFSDHDHVGQLIMIRYDPRRGCIEGYRVIAELLASDSSHPWELDGSVSIIEFTPRCRLHLDDAVLQLNPKVKALQNRTPRMVDSLHDEKGRCFADRDMFITHGISTKLSLASCVAHDHNIDLEEIWPSHLIPTGHRTLRVGENFMLGKMQHPETRAQINDHAFRIRHSLQAIDYRQMYSRGDFKHTYGTLDPELYLPTPDMPYRGIWVGEYNGHGSEFLLILQYDDFSTLDHPKIMERMEITALPERALMAVKLTGDPNVPRGQDSFFADLGESGVLRRATEQEFEGVMVVKSWGHIAETNFQHDAYIKNELFLISHNKLAQHWIDLRRINLYHRVDIASLLPV